jgi:hypothetical protein
MPVRLKTEAAARSPGPPARSTLEVDLGPGAGQVEGAGVFRGLRRELSRQRRWTRSLRFVALAAAITAPVALVGVTPAVARNAANHRARPEVGFTDPATSPRSKGRCQPEPGKTCPTTNPGWAGYVATPVSHDFTSVSASWVQKAVTCPQQDSWVVTWVGLDGWTDTSQKTVEQGGTSAQCLGGVPQYYVWWEMYPANDITAGFSIAVGDDISASVVFSSTADTYTVTVDDLTSGHKLVVVCSTNGAWPNPNTYTITTTSGSSSTTTGPTYFPQGNDNGELCSGFDPCENASAEWIVEAPGGDSDGPNSMYPLARFKPTIFTSAHATDTYGDQGSITDLAWQYTALDLTTTGTTGGTYLASANPLKRQGTQFRVIRD